jgi:hypothetical protein
MDGMALISDENVIHKIYIIRGSRVMFDWDLAELYGVETSQLKRQVKRNIERFPDDFMFTLDYDEYRDFLRCQFGILKRGNYSKYSPMVFTELGVAMLSSVLNSKRAIQVNIQIMRIFSDLHRMIMSHEDLKKKIIAMEKRYDSQFRVVFEAIKQLLKDDIKSRRKIGFKG